jgi:hypothetical protein
MFKQDRGNEGAGPVSVRESCRFLQLLVLNQVRWVMWLSLPIGEFLRNQHSHSIMVILR